MPFKETDITDKSFGYLTAVKSTNRVNKYNSRYWLFKCICGKEKEIAKNSVTCGKIKSCGCKKGELIYNTKIQRGVFGKIKLHSCGYQLKRVKGKSPYLHRQVMEKELLKYNNPSKMQIHHINGDKADNRKENLMVVDTKKHTRIENDWKLINKKWFKNCPSCSSFLEVNTNNFYQRWNGVFIYECKNCCKLKARKLHAISLKN